MFQILPKYHSFLVNHSSLSKPSTFQTLYSHLLEAPHAVQYVELLPAFGEVHLAVDEVRVAQVDEGQVLENESPGRLEGTERSCEVRPYRDALLLQHVSSG